MSVRSLSIFCSLLIYSPFSFFSIVNFSLYKSFISLARFITGFIGFFVCFVVFVCSYAVVNVSLPCCWLSAYRKASNLFYVKFVQNGPASLLNEFYHL